MQLVKEHSYNCRRMHCHFSTLTSIGLFGNTFGQTTRRIFLKKKKILNVFIYFQDKKGISGKQIPAERRTIYQRHIRPSTMLAKSILEGK